MSDDLINSSMMYPLMGSQLFPHCCSSEPLGRANWRVLGSAGLERWVVVVRLLAFWHTHSQWIWNGPRAYAPDLIISLNKRAVLPATHHQALVVSDLEARFLWREKQNETQPGKQEADGLGPWRAGNEPSTKELLLLCTRAQSHKAHSLMPSTADWKRVHPVL